MDNLSAISLEDKFAKLSREVNFETKNIDENDWIKKKIGNGVVPSERCE